VHPGESFVNYIGNFKLVFQVSIVLLLCSDSGALQSEAGHGIFIEGLNRIKGRW